MQPLLTSLATAASAPIEWNSLGLHPIIHDFGFFQLRWYSLAYLAGILIGWWYLLKLLARPGAPMARRHADDMVFYGTLGVILGGRIGYVLFYRPEFYFANPLAILRIMDGGMSFHGGAIGTSLAMFYLAWRNKLSVLRVHDYIACIVPIGLFFGRLANFVNHELWGRPTDVPWAVVFPDGGPVGRHPSQLYEAGLEGILLFTILNLLFWKTDARYQPGKLVGTFLLGYGLSRFFVEYFRQPDRGLEHLSWGLTMGQTLTVPMILIGLFLILTAKSRRERVEPFAGTESVA
ncbi:prolipoprotein diacylglyceryl transferase [Sphingosinicella sp. BN140058]|nr:prolipoprotein diacylglyceryl transferase [Sphingosinicella sp. BN140058]QAY79893.1 prolipoprotein diacylglyceryl transferase [Sphingosinicella sp. BN140058]